MFLDLVNYSEAAELKKKTDNKLIAQSKKKVLYCALIKIDNMFSDSLIIIFEKRDLHSLMDIIITGVRPEDSKR